MPFLPTSGRTLPDPREQATQPLEGVTEWRCARPLWESGGMNMAAAVLALLKRRMRDDDVRAIDWERAR